MFESEINRVAENIIIDRNGANYYSDVQLLANYLEASFDLPEAVARELAETVNRDRLGANYYQEARALAQFFNARIKVES